MMSKSYKIWCYITMIVFVVSSFIVGWAVCERYHLPKVIERTKVIYDSVFIPGPVQIVEKKVPVPAAVDTAAILEDYYSQRVYRDEVVQDKNLTITITDTVFNNRLLGRSIYTQLVPPKPKNNRLGISSLTVADGWALAMDYSYKRWSFIAGYDFINRSPMVGIRYNILTW